VESRRKKIRCDVMAVEHLDHGLGGRIRLCRLPLHPEVVGALARREWELALHLVDDALGIELIRVGVDVYPCCDGAWASTLLTGITKGSRGIGPDRNYFLLRHVIGKPRKDACLILRAVDAGLLQLRRPQHRICLQIAAPFVPRKRASDSRKQVSD
jgi:hypothetical protein